MKEIVRNIVDFGSAILLILLIVASILGFHKMVEAMAEITVTAVQQKVP